VLAIDLRQTPGILVDVKDGKAASVPFQSPVLPFVVAEIEREWGSGGPRLCDVLLKVEAVPSVEWALITLSGVLIQNIRKGYAVKNAGRRKS
jgi:hypothetical protein